ncbi:hypothetical protein CMV_020223 [Castanea mollissima]|uniref:Uncharacterized protein n=1 Tax=Castanea mollissima TaxID=60419 RepID=A0A8J4QM14_9ROSI|nr:hypothetical protein CMV_020223 [Castanea mollissima]
MMLVHQWNITAPGMSGCSRIYWEGTNRCTANQEGKGKKLINLFATRDIASLVTRDLRNDVELSLGWIVRQANLKIGSFADDRGFEKRRRTEPKPNRETQGPQDQKLR